MVLFCFQTVLEMTREEFYVLPSWKQQKLKQQASLFWTPAETRDSIFLTCAEHGRNQQQVMSEQLLNTSIINNQPAVSEHVEHLFYLQNRKSATFKICWTQASEHN